MIASETAHFEMLRKHLRQVQSTETRLFDLSVILQKLPDFLGDVANIARLAQQCSEECLVQRSLMQGPRESEIALQKEVAEAHELAKSSAIEFQGIVADMVVALDKQREENKAQEATLKLLQANVDKLEKANKTLVDENLAANQKLKKISGYYDQIASVIVASSLDGIQFESANFINTAAPTPTQGPEKRKRDQPVTSTKPTTKGLTTPVATLLSVEAPIAPAGSSSPSHQTAVSAQPVLDPTKITAESLQVISDLIKQTVPVNAPATPAAPRAAPAPPAPSSVLDISPMETSSTDLKVEDVPHSASPVDSTTTGLTTEQQGRLAENTAAVHAFRKMYKDVGGRVTLATVFHKKFVLEFSAEKIGSTLNCKLYRHVGFAAWEANTSEKGSVVLIRLLKGLKMVEDFSPQPLTFKNTTLAEKQMKYTLDDKVAFVRIFLWAHLMATYGEKRFVISTSGKGENIMAHHLTCPLYNAKLTDGEYGKDWDYTCEDASRLKDIRSICNTCRPMLLLECMFIFAGPKYNANWKTLMNKKIVSASPSAKTELISCFFQPSFTRRGSFGYHMSCLKRCSRIRRWITMMTRMIF